VIMTVFDSVSPHVALLPGAGGAGEFWEPVADRLPRHWPRTLFSWPGAGEQPHDPAVRGYADLIERTADALPEGSDLVAQSMGGVVAIGIALTHPEKVRRLVLVATSGGVAVGTNAENWRVEYETEFPHAAAWVTHDHVDYTDQIALITVPTCLIWGNADPVSPIDVGKCLRRTLPHSSLYVLHGGTHSLGYDRPDEVAPLIVQHLR
jgi:pimeloyl-ACP methyl ester carboxylesterase